MGKLGVNKFNGKFGDKFGDKLDKLNGKLDKLDKVGIGIGIGKVWNELGEISSFKFKFKLIFILSE